MFSCLTGSYSSSSAFITLLQTYTTIRGSCSISISIRTLCMLFCEKNLESSFSKMVYKSQIFELHWVSVCASAFGKLTQQLMQWNRAKGLIL